jgi:methyl-accepting chemotaxis protein
MDQMTQQNASLVQESTHATQALAQLSAQLRQLVAHFRINQSMGHAQASLPDSSPAPRAALQHSDF